MRQNSKPFKYEIKQTIGQLSVSHNGWQREVNIISWNDAHPKLDVRDWSPDRSKMSRGISLNGEEVKNFIHLMDAVNIDEMGIA